MRMHTVFAALVMLVIYSSGCVGGGPEVQEPSPGEAYTPPAEAEAVKTGPVETRARLMMPLETEVETYTTGDVVRLSLPLVYSVEADVTVKAVLRVDGVQAGTKQLVLKPSETYTIVDFTWVADAGKHALKVTLTPLGEVKLVSSILEQEMEFDVEGWPAEEAPAVEVAENVSVPETVENVTENVTEEPVTINVTENVTQNVTENVSAPEPSPVEVPIQMFAADPSEILLGESVELTLITRSQGTLDNIVADFYDGSSLITSKTFSATALAYQTVKHTWTPATAGSHTLKAVVRGTNVVTAEQTASLSVISPSAGDLSPSAISVSPESATDGDAVTITVGVYATADFANVEVGFYVDSGLIYTDSITIPANYIVNAQASWTATAGSHTIRAVIDPAGQHAEANEANNAIEKEVLVMIPEPAMPSDCSTIQAASSLGGGLTQKWSGPALRELAMADVDGDGLDEAIGVTSTAVAAYDYSGSALWSVAIPSSIGHFVSVADIDSDGKDNIIIGTDNAVQNIEGGAEVWKYSTTATVRSLTAGNVVAVGTSDNKVTVLGSGGTELWSASVPTTPTALLLMDVGSDGDKEVIVGGLGSVYAYDASGEVWGVLVQTQDSIYYLASGMLDGDAKADVAAALGNSLYALGNNGALLWSKGYCGVAASGVDIGDVDGDGLSEVAVSGGQPLTVFEHDGTVKWRRLVTDADWLGLAGLDILDADGDGQNEMIGGGCRLEIISSSGDIENEHRVCTVDAGYQFAGVAAGDMDGDGKAELFVRKIGSNPSYLYSS